MNTTTQPKEIAESVGDERQAACIDGQIFWRSAGETQWIYKAPTEAERLAQAFEATDAGDWFSPHAHKVAAQLREAIGHQREHNRRKDAA